jgi:release factor glutamine methyltransferase
LTIHTALQQGTELLAGSRLTAEVLLGHAMGRERTYFYAHPEQELREVEWLHYGRYLHERIKGKPTQYITHRQEFYGRDFRVTPDVLIPRPETELLVETVLKLRSTGRAVDVGTGSGAIAITLELESALEVFATEISPEALKIAIENSKPGTRGGSRVRYIQTDLLAAIADTTIDVVVSNPPYIPETDRDSLQPEVRDWEPPLALFAGTDGLGIYRRLIPEAHRVLKPGGLLALEIGYGQSEAVASLAARWKNLRVLPDLAGIPRVLVCEKP